MDFRKKFVEYFVEPPIQGDDGDAFSERQMDRLDYHTAGDDGTCRSIEALLAIMADMQEQIDFLLCRTDDDR